MNKSRGKRGGEAETIVRRQEGGGTQRRRKVPLNAPLAMPYQKKSFTNLVGELPRDAVE